MSATTSIQEDRIDTALEATERQPSAACPPRLEPVPAWKKCVNVPRAVASLLAVLATSWIIEGWVRLTILPWCKEDEDRKARRMNGMVRRWGVWTWRCLRVGLRLKLAVKGDPPASGRYLIVANHQSSADIPALITIFRALNLKFVAMEELRYGKPGVSLALRHGGFACVAKRNLGEDLATLEKFGRRLKRLDGSAVIFPEGQRTEDGAILPFHFAGTETVRRTSGLPILAVTIDGFWKARSLKQYYRLVGTTIHVCIAEPIPFTDVDRDPRRTLQEVEEKIRRDLDEIRGTSAMRD